MPEDYYGGGEESGADAHSPEQDNPEKDSGKTFLINSEVCPGMKAGDEMIVKIERVLEGEYEVSYAPEKGKEESEPEPEPSMTEPQGGGMSGMFE